MREYCKELTSLSSSSLVSSLINGGKSITSRGAILNSSKMSLKSWDGGGIGIKGFVTRDCT